MLNVDIVVMYMHVKNDFTFLVFISVSYDYHFFKNSPKCRMVSQIRKKKRIGSCFVKFMILSFLEQSQFYYFGKHKFHITAVRLKMSNEPSYIPEMLHYILDIHKCQQLSELTNN